MMREGADRVNCTEARRMVAAYVNKELSVKDMEAFLDHIEHCSDCMDELDVYFTVYRALNSLDDGEHQELNFKKMLEEDIRMERKAIFRKKTISLVRMVLLFAAELLLLLSVYTGYGRKKGETALESFRNVIQQFYSGETPEEQSDAGTEDVQSEMTERSTEQKIETE